MQSKSKEKQSEELEAFKRVFSTPDGKLAIKYILSYFPLKSENFTGDPYKDAFLNGKRAMGLTLLSLFDKDRFMF